jgi:hypothetical protein
MHAYEEEDTCEPKGFGGYAVELCTWRSNHSNHLLRRQSFESLT